MTRDIKMSDEISQVAVDFKKHYGRALLEVRRLRMLINEFEHNLSEKAMTRLLKISPNLSKQRKNLTTSLIPSSCEVRSSGNDFVSWKAH